MSNPSHAMRLSVVFLCLVGITPPSHTAVSGENLDFVGRSLAPRAWGGLDVDSASQRVFVAFRRTVSVFDALDPARPALLGWVDLDRPVEGLHYPGSGPYLYVAAEGAGLVIVNVSDPAAPSVVSATPTNESAFGVWVTGGRAYVANGNAGLYIYDVSNSAAPLFLGSADPAGHTWGVHVVGTRAYVAYGPDGLHIIDVSNPSSPVPLGSYNTPDFAWNVFVVGGLAYVADGFSGVRILDVSVPSAPVPVGTYPGERIRDVRVAGDVLYAADREGSVLLVLDVSNPASPQLLSAFDTPGLPWRVRVAGNRAFVNDDWDGLQILDVTDPAEPSVLGGYRSVQDAKGTFVAGRYAYVADGPRGLLVVDALDLDAPRIVAVHDTPGVARDVFVRDHIAYVADETSLQVVDVSDPEAPSTVGALTGVFQGATDLWVEGNYAYIANASDGVYIVDVSNPAAPTLAGSNFAPIRTEDIVVRDGIAYVADGATGLIVLDVSDPANTSVLGRADPDGQFDGNALAVSVLGPWAYLADELQQQIDVINVTNPANPTPNNQIPVEGRPHDLFVAGDTIHVASGDAGLRIYDRSRFPNFPLEVASLSLDETLGSFQQSVAFRSGFGWLTDPWEGGYVARWNGQCRDAFEPSDDFDWAAPADPGVGYQGKICDQTDRDFFAVAVPAGGTLDVTMTPPAGKDYDLRAFDPARIEIGASSNGAGQGESLSLTVIDPGTYALAVEGKSELDYSASAFYDLSYSFVLCPAPPLEVRIVDVALDASGDVVLTVEDDNPSGVTGYNVYRSSVPSGTFDRISTDAQDADPGTPGVQHVDTGSATEAPLYYLVAAFNGACGGEGPR